MELISPCSVPWSHLPRVFKPRLPHLPLHQLLPTPPTPKNDNKKENENKKFLYSFVASLCPTRRGSRERFAGTGRRLELSREVHLKPQRLGQVHSAEPPRSGLLALWTSFYALSPPHVTPTRIPEPDPRKDRRVSVRRKEGGRK